MTQAQMVLEKITLQKCLLYFESLHGRPVSPLQLMAPSLARMKNSWEADWPLTQTMMVTTPPTQVQPSCFGVVIERQHICSGDKGDLPWRSSLVSFCVSLSGNQTGEEAGEASVWPLPDDQMSAVCQPHHQHHRKIQTHTCPNTSLGWR